MSAAAGPAASALPLLAAALAPLCALARRIELPGAPSRVAAEAAFVPPATESSPALPAAVWLLVPLAALGGLSALAWLAGWRRAGEEKEAQPQGAQPPAQQHGRSFAGPAVALFSALLLLYKVWALADVRSQWALPAGGTPEVGPAGAAAAATPQAVVRAAALEEVVKQFTNKTTHHHACITGDDAHEAAGTLLRAEGGSAALQELRLTSQLSQEVCSVHEGRLGSTLLTVSPAVLDRCAARWRGQSATCDLRLHVQAGRDCEELFKIRLIDSDCERPMVVVSPSAGHLAALRQCFDRRIDEFEKEHAGAVGAQCRANMAWVPGVDSPSRASTRGVGRLDTALAQAITLALGATSIWSPVLPRGRPTDLQALRKELHEAYARRPDRHLDLHEELMRSYQGLPHARGAAGAAASFLQVGSERASRGKGSGYSCNGRGQGCAIIIDNSPTLSAGFAGEKEPRVQLEGIVGRPKYVNFTIGGKVMSNIYVGEEAFSKRGLLSLKFPLEHGITGAYNKLNAGSWVEVWDDMQEIWQHIFEKLQVDVRDHPVLLTEKPLNSKENRDHMAQVMFENFEVPAFYVADSAVLALYAANRTTGCVLDSGHISTYAVPVYEGFALPHAIGKVNFGGKQLTTYTSELLSDRGYDFTAREYDIANDIKKKLAYVAFDFEQELQRSEEDPAYIERSYKLPPFNVNGDEVVVGTERFRIAESMFDLRKLGPDVMEAGGIDKLLYDTIQMKSSIDTRAELFDNIILAGGNTNFPGLDKRLKKELEMKLPPTVRVSVSHNTNDKHSPWKGASIMATMPSFQHLWLSREDYDLSGTHKFRSVI